MPSARRPPEDKFAKYRAAYTAPKSDSSLKPIRSKGREHPILLILWLAGYVVFSILGVMQLASDFILLSRAVPSFALVVLLVIGIVEMVSALGIFQWKRLGVYGLLGAVTLSLCLRVFVGFARPESIVVIIVAYVMVYAFVRPNWEYYT